MLSVPTNQKLDIKLIQLVYRHPTQYVSLIKNLNFKERLKLRLDYKIVQGEITDI